MPVAQSVEDDGEQFAGGGDHTDIASAAGSDLVADLPEPGAFTDSLDGLDGGPADQFAALFICGYLDIKSAGDPRLTYLWLPRYQVRR
jgi:hypothetical protein